MVSRVLSGTVISTVVFLVAFVFFALIAGFADNGGGIASTKLTSDLTATATVTSAVTSTTGFNTPAATAYYVVEDEDIGYAAWDATHFKTLTRGLHGTTPAAHSSGKMVYSENAGVINSALGFDIATTKTKVGDVAIPIFALKLITVTIPHISVWDFNFLQSSDTFIVLFRVFLMCISAGLYLSLAIALLTFTLSRLIP